MTERAPEPDKAAQKQVRMEEAAARKSAVAERRALTREVEKLDKQLAGWQMEKARLDDQLADPALYEDRGKLTASLKRQAELTALIDPAELRWLEIHEVLEAMSVE